MAPPWVLLDRKVSFVRSGPPVFIGRWDYDEMLEATTADMKTMKPNLDIADPPDVSRLSMVRQMDVREVPCGFISCTDKALVLLYAGLPGIHKGYLVYDASSNSISWIPTLPDSLKCMARAAVLSLGKGSYVLAEFVRGLELGDVTLYLWRSTSNPNRGRWIRSAARLPPHLFTCTYYFHIDTVFSYGRSCVCWVDLLQGVLICDLLKSPEPEFKFVPLPLGYSIDVPIEPCEGQRVYRPHPEVFRTMGCIGGTIKFVTVVGYHGNHSHHDMLLESWTLSHDHKEWKLGKSLSVLDFWGSESFREKNLPQLKPSFPILNMDDAETINVILNDIEYEKKVNFFGEVRRGKTLLKAQYMISLNIVKNKVISSRKLTPKNPGPRFPDLIATDFSSYTQVSKDDSAYVTSKAETSKKRKYEGLTLGSGI